MQQDVSFPPDSLLTTKVRPKVRCNARVDADLMDALTATGNVSRALNVIVRRDPEIQQWLAAMKARPAKAVLPKKRAPMKKSA